MNFSVLTFGCKVNQGESEDIISKMISFGYKFEGKKSSDIVIINSCSVTAESDRKLRQCIRKIRKENQNAIIVLTGCMPQAFPEVASGFSEVQIVVGNTNKFDIPELIENYIKNKEKKFEVEDIKKVLKYNEIFFVSQSKERYRAFLKIEDGCDRFCSYCIIPYARGRVRSKPLQDIKENILQLCKNNYKEIVLTGINLSSYGKDLNCSLEDAIKITCDCKDVKRVRLGSLEPDLITENLLNYLSKENKFCPQFHLALQSGSNNVLKRMRRRYTREQYLDLVNLIKEKFPLATFTTDIMVGFPGETEEDFIDTLNIIKEVGFLKVHVFPYSVRPGTLAADFDFQIDKSLKTQRVQKTIDISKETSRIILRSFMNFNTNVLYESKDENGFYRGYTENYIPVKSKNDQDISGKILKTSIIKLPENEDFCIGQIIS